MEHDRIVALDGPLNFRDIGGYKNNKGQHVKWNKIYRSDSLSSLSKEDECESVSQFFYILNSVDQQRGCCNLGENK